MKFYSIDGSEFVGKDPKSIINNICEDRKDFFIECRPNVNASLLFLTNELKLIKKTYLISYFNKKLTKFLLYLFSSIPLGIFLLAMAFGDEYAMVVYFFLSVFILGFVNPKISSFLSKDYFIVRPFGNSNLLECYANHSTEE